MATSRFVDLWTEGDDSVATDRANAVLSVAEPGDPPKEVAVTFRDPRPDGNSLSYQVNVLDGTLRTNQPVRLRCLSTPSGGPSPRICGWDAASRTRRMRRF